MRVISEINGADLTQGKAYEVVNDLAAKNRGYIRIIDDSGQEYLYPAKSFSPEKKEEIAV